LIWASTETMQPDLMFAIIKIEECRTAWSDNVAKLLIKGVDVNNTRRSPVFSFTGNSAKESAELCENWIKRLKVNSQKI